MNDTALQQLLDRSAITDLVSRLGLWLDEDRTDEGARALLVEDVTVDTPGGQSTGIDRVVAQAQRNHDYLSVQHVITNVLIDLDGDRATVRANLVVTLADETVRSTQGERYRFETRRTTDGWRLSHIGVAQVWKRAS